MSAFPSSPRTSPPAAPIVAGEPAKAQEGPPRWPIYIFLAALLAGSVWYLRPRAQQKTTAAPAIPTARVYRGMIDPTRRVAGSISAGRFANVAAPVLQAPDTGRGLTLTFLAQSGTRVKKGQRIAEIDAQDIKDHLDDVEAGIVQARLDIKRRQAQLLAQMENLKQGLRASRPRSIKPNKTRAPSPSPTPSARKICGSPSRNIRRPTMKP